MSKSGVAEGEKVLSSKRQKMLPWTKLIPRAWDGVRALLGVTSARGGLECRLGPHFGWIEYSTKYVNTEVRHKEIGVRFCARALLISLKDVDAFMYC